MKNSPSTLDSIREVWNDYASHVIGPDGSCCRGCRLARQIPNLLDDIAELRRGLDRIYEAAKTGAPQPEYAEATIAALIEEFGLMNGAFRAATGGAS